jgi:DNA polymerase lambda
MADKIAEILEDGQLRKVQEVCDSERVRVLELFTRVWGAGPTTADLWYRQGCRSLDDLRQRATLNKHQAVGLRLFDDLDQRMPRAEAQSIYEYVKHAAGSIKSGKYLSCSFSSQLRLGDHLDLDVVACGSFRRGKTDCGDLDILITHSDFDADDNAIDGLFSRLLDDLRASGFLTDDLSVQRDGRQRKYLGVCRLPQHLHRRLDIIVVPFSERAPALLYFTGSAHFNRSMRLLAQKVMPQPVHRASQC